MLPQHRSSIFYCTMFKVGSVVSSPVNAQHFGFEALGPTEVLV